jgi:chromosomal replication initiator protein
MIKDHQKVWDNCLQTIEKHVNKQSFKTWFEPIKPVRLADASLTIQVPNNFFYEWLEENYVGLLKKTIRQELGDDGRLEYQIVVPNHLDATFHVNPDDSNFYSTDSITNPFVIPGIKRMRIQPQINPKYTFDTFIEGDCNKLSRSAGMAIAKNPGGTAFNPLVIYGDVGLGKTHLAHAIGNEVVEAFPNKNVLYVSTERFTNQIIEAIKKNNVNDLMNYYLSIDLLIVDDIQFLAGRAKTQEIFFNIFNQLHQIGKQIVLTSDCAPKSLEGIQDRLISRFKWGLSADLQTPDFETRIAILRDKVSKENILLTEDIIEFIAFNVKDNVRELEGVLISLIAQSSLNNKTIDLSLAKKMVESYVSGTTREITIDSIKQLVADHMHVPIEKLHSSTRKREVVIARQLSMYLAKNHTNNSFKAIGDNFGGRDHSTVIYSCKTVQDLMDTDILFRDIVFELEKKVQLSITSDRKS